MGNLMSRITDCQRQMKSMFDVFEGTTPRVLILGLDGAGKTTLMYSAKLDDFIYAIAPPTGVIIEHVTPRRSATMQLLDLPGSKLSRHLWHNWFPKSEAVIYVVDSADKVRIDEAKFELHDLLTSRWLRKVPLIVVANKQDLSESMSEEDVAKELDLPSISNRDWSIVGISAKKGKGVMNIFVDTMGKIKAYRHYKNSLIDKVNAKTHTEEKDAKREAQKGDGGPVFTSIEDVDAMEEENIPSLFASINKTTDTKPDAEDETTDSGLSSRESIMYDQIDDTKKPDSINDKDSEHSADERSSDSGHEEETSNAQTEKSQELSSQNSERSDDISVEVETHDNEKSQELSSQNSERSDDISVEVETHDNEKSQELSSQNSERSDDISVEVETHDNEKSQELSSQNSERSDDISVEVETHDTERRNSTQPDSESEISGGNDTTAEVETHEHEIRNDSKVEADKISEIDTMSNISAGKVDNIVDADPESDNESDEDTISTISDTKVEHQVTSLNGKSNETDSSIVNDDVVVRPDDTVNEAVADGDTVTEEIKTNTLVISEAIISDEDSDTNMKLEAKATTNSEIDHVKTDNSGMVTDLDCVSDEDSGSLV